MPPRKQPLSTNHFYHVVNRGVANESIYKTSKDYSRFLLTIQYYQFDNPPLRYSFFIKQAYIRQNEIIETFHQKENKLIDLTCYCFMPNHYHLLIKQIKHEGISEYIRLLSNSYAKYFNIKNKRNGPLFQGRFKAVRIQTDEQLLHVSRYIHLNPYSSSLVNTSDELISYPYSSLKEYVRKSGNLCNKKPVLEHFENPQKYLKFIKNNADFQRSLQKIKNSTLA